MRPRPASANRECIFPAAPSAPPVRSGRFAHPAIALSARPSLCRPTAQVVLTARRAASAAPRANRQPAEAAPFHPRSYLRRVPAAQASAARPPAARLADRAARSAVRWRSAAAFLPPPAPPRFRRSAHRRFHGRAPACSCRRKSAAARPLTDPPRRQVRNLPRAE